MCNLDPKMAAEMIGPQKFSPKVRKKLNYDYSPSSWISYCSVKGIDLRDHGFGRCNFFHTTENDINKIFNRMYEKGDYKKPSFAISFLINEITFDRNIIFSWIFFLLKSKNLYFNLISSE